MPSRVYKCDSCNKASMITWEGSAAPQCACGSKSLRKIPADRKEYKAAVKRYETAQKLSATKPPPVTIKTPPTSTIPTAPPMPTGGKVVMPVNPAHQKFIDMQKSHKPSGKTLGEELKASTVGVLDTATGARTVNRTALDQRAWERYWASARSKLPPRNIDDAPEDEIGDLLRVVVNNVKSKKIPNVRIRFLYHGKEHFLPGRYTVDLTLPLAELATGVCRPYEHANAGSSFGNKELLLPTNVEGEEVGYVEFGWRYRVPPSAFRKGSNKFGDYTAVDVSDEDGPLDKLAPKVAIAKWIANNGGTIDAGLRLVVSDWGYLFFTANHYETFKIYDPVEHEWNAYESLDYNADASWYHSGEMNSNWILPVDAPSYW